MSRKNQYFRKGSKLGLAPTKLDEVVGNIRIGLSSVSPAKESVRTIYALESASNTEVERLETYTDNIAERVLNEVIVALEGASAELTHDDRATFGNGRFTAGSREAAIHAAVLALDPQAFASQPVQTKIAMEGVQEVALSPADAISQRPVYAAEAYDERSTKDGAVYTIAWNLSASKQDEFGEAFFPTTNISPDQVGFYVSIRLIEVQNDIRRQISGDLTNFNRRNLIEAYVDPSVLANNATEVIPVFRTESAKWFSTLVPTSTIAQEYEPVPTRPLKFGKEFSLIGISQTDRLLETGLMTVEDQLDTAATLRGIYLALDGATDGAGVVKFDTRDLAYAKFNYAVQGNYRQLNLAFATTSLLIDKDTKALDGSTPAAFAPIVANSAQVYLKVKVNGTINCDTGATELTTGEVTVARVVIDGQDQDFTVAGTAKTIADLFEDSVLDSYTVQINRVNSDRRQRGQLLNTNMFTQAYPVQLRSPITVTRPYIAGDANDASDLAALIATTRVRTSNDAVGAVIDTAATLAAYVRASQANAPTPEIQAIGRYLVKPFYEKHTLDVKAELASLRSADVATDVEKLIVNLFRDIAYRAYRDTRFKAAADVYHGGLAPIPTVIIGGDPVLTRYLNVTGDTRTLGNGFNVQIVSTLDQRLTGKLFGTFGYFDQSQEGGVNPLHFGAMAWCPELTLILPTHRAGQNSKEITVTPRYLHVNNLPVLWEVEVTNLTEGATTKTTLLVDNQDAP